MKDYGTRPDGNTAGDEYLITTLLHQKLNWKFPNGAIWTTVSEVLDHIGVPANKSTTTMTGRILRREFNVRARRYGNTRLVYVPRP